MPSFYMFIDGASFENTVSEIGQNVIGEQNLLEIVNFERIARNYTRVFYYDSLPVKRSGQSDDDFQLLIEQKKRLFDVISETAGCHVRTGMSRYRKKRGQEQKGVDILLAIDVLQHAHLGNIESATIVTSDLDFLPLLDALTQTRVQSRLFYRPKVTPKDLIQSADFAGTIHCNKLTDWCNINLLKNLSVSRSQMGKVEKFIFSDEFQAGDNIYLRGKYRDPKLADMIVVFSKREYEEAGDRCLVYSSINENAILWHISEEKHIKYLDG